MKVRTISCCLYALATLLLTAATVAAEEKPIGHWVFDRSGVKGESVKDVVGKTDATIRGKVNFAKVGSQQAIVLDGAENSVLIHEDYNQARVPKKEITAEAWVRVDAPNNWGGIVGVIQDNGSYERGWLLGFNGSHFSFALKAKEGSPQLLYLKADKPFVPRQWYHVAGTYDGKETRVYVNGRLAASAKAHSGEIDYPPKAHYEIGAYHDEDENYRMGGMVHEVRVYDRTLSAEQIAAHYKAKADSFPAPPTIQVADVFGSHMVLQRGRQIRIWGDASAGERVSVKFAGQQASATADKKGRWSVALPSLKAGGPHRLTVQGSKDTVTLNDVLVGEVWVCSGQSNMQWGVNNTRNSAAEIAAAKHPRLRLFGVPQAVAKTPQRQCNGTWSVCSPQTVPGFSAVAYFFGLHLHKELDVPVGLINTSWGGSLCEAWTSREALQSDPDFNPILQRAATNLGQGTGMYNKMIHPLIPVGIRGAIWYQGESNVSRAEQYRKLFPAMIRDWRTHWGQGDFPFYYVQLAPFNYRGNNVACAELWEAQLKTLSVANTGMAVTTDIGNVGNIHPRNKQDVGKRLALWALAKDYGKHDLVYSGPIYKSSKIDGDRIRIRFDHVGSGLAARDGKPLSWFTIAGADKKFQPATATIEKGSIAVHSDQIKKPVAVRFAWHGTALPNLANREGLPASPFRTDNWQLVTAGRK